MTQSNVTMKFVLEIEISDLNDIADVERETRSIVDTYFKQPMEMRASVWVIGLDGEGDDTRSFVYNGEDQTFGSNE